MLQPNTAFCSILYIVMWNSLYLRYPSEMLTSILIILQNFTELACLEVATPKIVVGVMMYIGRKLVENLAATKSCSIQFMPMQHHCKVEHWSKFSINFQHRSHVAYHSKLLINFQIQSDVIGTSQIRYKFWLILDVGVILYTGFYQLSTSLHVSDVRNLPKCSTNLPCPFQITVTSKIGQNARPIYEVAGTSL